MSQPEPSSQDSTDTQEGSFQEIWESFKQTYFNPDKETSQGFMTVQTPLIVRHTDVLVPDNLEFSFEQRIFKSLEPSPPETYSQQLSELPKSSPVVNVTGTTGVNKLYKPVLLPSIFPNTNHPGMYKFSVGFETNTAPITKATPWVYVVELEKLFVKRQLVCPILFKITGSPPPGSGVRGILMYKEPEYYKDIVTQCPFHKNTSKDDHPYQMHVMQCENLGTIYDSCPRTERLSLFIPLSDTYPFEGKGYFKELLKFTCFNSCVGGMKKRSTFLIFRLECGGTSFGHAVVEIRICASPARDSAKNTQKQNGPTSTTDVITSMPLPSTHSPGSSPTTLCPPRTSVLMSASKDPSSAPEPFQFPAFQTQKRKEYLVSKDGFVNKRVKKKCPADSTKGELIMLAIEGQERYEIIQKIIDGLYMMDGIKPPVQLPHNRYAYNGIEPTQEYTKIQPKTQTLEVTKEKPDFSQYNISPQLSRTSSNASPQSSTAQNPPEYSATVFTMKRTITIKKSSVPEAVLMQLTP